MKKRIYPKGFCAIIYYIFFIIFLFIAILFILFAISMEGKNLTELDLAMCIVGTLMAVVGCYCLISSVRIKIVIIDNEFIVKGQPIRYKNRIQHSFTMNIDEISKIYIRSDEYNSKGEKFSSLNPSVIYERFIYFEMQDGKIYKLWLKHFSIKQKKELLNIKK